MDAHNDSFFSNTLLENIDNNIPLSTDILTPYKNIPHPNKKQTPPLKNTAKQL